MLVKELFRKTGGTQFYHFVQSLSTEDDITRHRSGVRTETVPGFRGVVATHIDAGSIHLLASSGFRTSERLHWLMNAKESTSFS
jgi:hypothetical protein